jgi:hypothetical protein
MPSPAHPLGCSLGTHWICWHAWSLLGTQEALGACQVLHLGLARMGGELHTSLPHKQQHFPGQT